MNLIKAPGERGSGPFSPLREAATFPPQADHVLVVFFFGRGGTWGAALKPPDKKELLHFRTTWMELESIILSEISQVVKDKYHVISPISGT